MKTVDYWKLPELPARYVEELMEAKEYSKAAKYEVEFGHLQMQKSLLIEHELGGDLANLSASDMRVTSRYMEIDRKLSDLEDEARTSGGASMKSDTPVFDDIAEKYKDLEFLKEDKGRFTEVVSGWYQNSIGDLFHYDGVIWDNVPDEQIKTLEFLGG